MIFQGAEFKEVLTVMHYGLQFDTENTFVNDLLSRGGLASMEWTITLILCAMAYSGIMDASGQIRAFIKQILKLVSGLGSLVATTIATAIIINFIAGDLYPSMVLTGKMYKDTYIKRFKLAPQNLSRVIETGGTLTSSFCPWNTCGAAMMGFLGVSPFAYIPYTFFNLVNIVVEIILSKLGIGIFTVDENGQLQKIRTKKEKTAAEQV